MKNILTFANKHRVTQLSDHTTIFSIMSRFQNPDCDDQSEEHTEDEADWILLDHRVDAPAADQLMTSITLQFTHFKLACMQIPNLKTQNTFLLESEFIL